MKIDHCVCYNVSFQSLKDNKETNMSKIGKLYGCGTKCGMCVPYIKEMIKSGKTVFTDPIVEVKKDDNI